MIRAVIAQQLAGEVRRPELRKPRELPSGVPEGTPGTGVLSRSVWEVGQDVASGRLVCVLDDYAAPPNGIHAVFAQRKHLPLRVRLWVEFLKRTYGEPRYWDSPPPGGGLGD